MIDHQDVMRLTALDFYQAQVVGSIGCGRNTMGRALKRIEQEGLPGQKLAT